MGAGIAVRMAETYNLREAMNKIGMLPWPSCMYINGVLNMVTKERSNDKPSYTDFAKALRELHKVCDENNIRSLVMPRIGCGLDALDWSIVSSLLEYELPDFDILVCVMGNPCLSIEEYNALSKFRNSCLSAVRAVALGLGPVMLLGKEFKDDPKPLLATVTSIDRWLSGNGLSEKDVRNMKNVLDRLSKE